MIASKEFVVSKMPFSKPAIILCCNIPQNVCKDELMEVFKTCGTILAIQLAMDTSRNLHLGYGWTVSKDDFTEVILQEIFEVHGPIWCVKMSKNYAYMRFENRDDAVHALDPLDGYDLYGATWEISLTKPKCVKWASDVKEEKNRKNGRIKNTVLHGYLKGI
ncbi:hypothetical protein DAPPUDRAFT_249496 [Daphnia pulex]|uniref:RRM domain-containing protein n=1 Tax=Daphnia pulex TaxID=6669 RepID=E9GWS0_DAPPU|nr:hypothetical protein DAPPUDRAFT_249496 [Daphnia pulex]|eukprot:EFX76067.1 hypothetical protein DAPPUDRAFT_249496 [Daphnia pulex]